MRESVAHGLRYTQCTNSPAKITDIQHRCAPCGFVHLFLNHISLHLPLSDYLSLLCTEVLKGLMSPHTGHRHQAY